MSVKALGASDNDHVIFTSDQTASDEFNKVINYLASHTFLLHPAPLRAP